MDSNTDSAQPPEPSGPLEWLERPQSQEPPEPEPPGWLEAPAHREPPEPPEWLERPAHPELAEWPADPDPQRLELPDDLPEDLAELAAAIDQLAAQQPERLSGPARVQRTQGLRWLLDRLEGHWLQELAGLDTLGAASTDPQCPAPSTASWLRRRLRMGAGAASDNVRTARALFRGSLTQTAQALTSGEISPAHARVLATGTRQLPDRVAAAAEPVLLEAARRLDPPLLRQAVGYLVGVADPTPTAAGRPDPCSVPRRAIGGRMPRARSARRERSKS